MNREIMFGLWRVVGDAARSKWASPRVASAPLRIHAHMYFTDKIHRWQLSLLNPSLLLSLFNTFDPLTALQLLNSNYKVGRPPTQAIPCTMATSLGGEINAATRSACVLMSQSLRPGY